jgi:hypothetical protein
VSSRRTTSCSRPSASSMRTQYDLEMMSEVGYCNGIENYSRHLDGREPASRRHPARLLPRRLPARDRRVATSRAADHGACTPATAAARTCSSSTASGCRARSTTARSRSRSARAGQPVRVRVGHPRRLRARVSGRRRRADHPPHRPRRPEAIEVKPTKGQIDDLMEMATDRRPGRARARHHAHQEDGRGPHRLPARAGRPGPLPALATSTPSSASRSCGPCARRLRRARRHQPAARGPRPARGVAGGHPRRRQGGLPPVDVASSRPSAAPPATSTGRCDVRRPGHGGRCSRRSTRRAPPEVQRPTTPSTASHGPVLLADRRERLGPELVGARYAVVPEGVPRRDLVEGQQLLDPAVAVRAHDEDRRLQADPRRPLDAEDQIVVELPLRPEREEGVPSRHPPEHLEELPEGQFVRQHLHHRALSLRSAPRASSRLGAAGALAPG